LTVTADSQSKLYGAALPAWTATYTGFVHGDTQSVLSGSPSLTSTATASSAVGNYTITAGLGNLAATNYSFSYVNGTLTVTPAPLTITANNQSKLYGAALPVLTDSLRWVRQWRYIGQPHGAAHADDYGHGFQQCGQLRDHRQWRGGCQLYDQLRGRQLNGPPRRR